MKFKNIYVAATSQHVGKTTSTLGIVSAFIKKMVNIGYSKPVGQQFLDIGNLKVDKDIILFSDLLGFEMVPEWHSPVILGKGATELFLDNPGEYDYRGRILEAKMALEERHDLVIYEGTGHPGVGTVAGVSNAEVASLLDAGVVMVVEGGIGKTIDMLNMTTALFREKNVPIMGVVINKVIEEKLEKVKQYVSKWLEKENIPLLGVVPYDKTLAYPLMSTVAKAIGGTILRHEDQMRNKVADIIAGVPINMKKLDNPEDLLLITDAKYISKAVDRIKMATYMLKLEESPLSGIILTGAKNCDAEVLEFIDSYKIPVVHTQLDTYSSVLKISRIEVKINRHTPWKVARAIRLIEDNVNLDDMMIPVA
jgi:dethiobiotin synthetase